MACSSVCASQLWSLPLSFISRSLPSAEDSAPPLSASIQAVSDTTSPGQKDGFVWQIRLRRPRVYSGLCPHLCEHFVPALHHHWLDISRFLGCLSTDVAFIKSFQLGWRGYSTICTGNGVLFGAFFLFLQFLCTCSRGKAGAPQFAGGVSALPGSFYLQAPAIEM